MQLSEIFFLGIVLYLSYRFVFNFLLPIVRTTKQVKEQFRHMQDHMQNQAGGYQQEPRQPGYFQGASQPWSSTSQTRPGTRQKPDTGAPVKDKAGSKGDYIDFEEIK